MAYFDHTGTSHSQAIRSKYEKERKTWNDNNSGNRTTRRVSEEQ